MCVLLVRFSGRKHKQLTNHQTGLWWVRKPWCCSCGSMIEETASAATNTYINVWLPRFGTFSPFVVHLSMLWFVAHQTSPISIGNLITCMYIYMIIIYVYSMCFFFTILYAHIFATNAIYRWMFLLPLNVHLGQRFRRSLWPSNRSNRCLALHRKLHKEDISGNWCHPIWKPNGILNH